MTVVIIPSGLVKTQTRGFFCYPGNKRLAAELGLAIYGFYLIRKSKRTEILALWNRKWNRDQQDQ